MEGPRPEPQQQQPTLRQLEQQQQRTKTPDDIDEAQRHFKAELEWVKHYEPDRLW